jgi:hypothetical protein
VSHHGPSASGLYAGVGDGEPVGVDADLCQALGLRLAERVVVATREGVVREARGSDDALLDLAPLSGKCVGLVDVPRDDWDAPLLLRAFRESAWARATATRFELVSLELLEKGHQRRISSYDFATGFERAERPAWLIEVLKQSAGPDAWLFGPWLGVKRALARELAHGVGVAVGEVTSPLGGVAGARFEARRDALLAALGAELRRELVQAVHVTGEGVALELEGGARLDADAAVLATGGFVSGAIALTGALSGAEPAGFELTIRGLPSLHVAGAVDPISSLYGVDLAARGRRLLEHVGVAASAEGRVRGAARVYVAGDLLGAGAPSVGQALTTGLRAGTAAALGH